jgi:hypothetical protein
MDFLFSTAKAAHLMDLLVANQVVLIGDGAEYVVLKVFNVLSGLVVLLI